MQSHGSGPAESDAMTIGKRDRERARREHQREKEERRKRRLEGKAVAPRVPGEDPDIAGIVSGPQPVVES